MRKNMNSHKDRGFSLLEMLTVVAIGFILAGVGFVSMMPILRKGHVDSGYDTTLMVLRSTRHLAIVQGHEYKVTINPSGYATGTLLVQYQPPSVGGVYPPVQTVSTYTIPSDISFAVKSGFPTSTPDGFGTGVLAIDFGYTPSGGAGGSNVLVFMPDGSARDGTSLSNGGTYSSGIVYLTRTQGSLPDCRAITVWGATGRIRGWRLGSFTGSVYKWVQQ